MTLKEIASKYDRTPKTFRKYVLELGIPHVRLGRSMIFDPGKVERFLEGKTLSPVRTLDLSDKKPAKSQYNTGSRFVGVLG